MDPRPTASRARILLVDDDENYLDLASRRLSRSGYEIFKARSWAEAGGALLKQPHLALLDIHLGSVDGDEICRILKRQFPEIKVLLISSDDDARLRTIAASTNADGWISKAAGHEALLRRIDQELG